MKTRHVLMPLLAVVILATCASGCLSTNPTNNQNNNNTTSVPVFQPSVRTAAVETSEGKITTYQTTSSAAQVIDFYKTEMTKRGYQVTTSYQASPSNAGSNTVLSCVKGASTVRIAVATIKAEIGPLNLTKEGATTFVITENAGTS